MNIRYHVSPPSLTSFSISRFINSTVLSERLSDKGAKTETIGLPVSATVIHFHGLQVADEVPFLHTVVIGGPKMPDSANSCMN